MSDWRERIPTDLPPVKYGYTCGHGLTDNCQRPAVVWGPLWSELLDPEGGTYVTYACREHALLGHIAFIRWDGGEVATPRPVTP